MCLFKRKPKHPENAKYKKGDYVNFRFRDDLYFGYIVTAKEENGDILYNIQIAGQCPAVIENFSEQKIVGLKTK